LAVFSAARYNGLPFRSLITKTFQEISKELFEALRVVKGKTLLAFPFSNGGKP